MDKKLTREFLDFKAELDEHYQKVIDDDPWERLSDLKYNMAIEFDVMLISALKKKNIKIVLPGESRWTKFVVDSRGLHYQYNLSELAWMNIKPLDDKLDSFEFWNAEFQFRKPLMNHSDIDKDKVAKLIDHFVKWHVMSEKMEELANQDIRIARPLYLTFSKEICLSRESAGFSIDEGLEKEWWHGEESKKKFREAVIRNRTKIFAIIDSSSEELRRAILEAETLHKILVNENSAFRTLKFLKKESLRRGMAKLY